KYKLLFFCLLWALPLFSYGQNAPFFVKGSSLTLTVCKGSPQVVLDTMLQVLDLDNNNQLTWSVVTPPANGTANISDSQPSTGDTVTPSGLLYQPTAGYSGPDAFTVQVF